MCLPCGRRACDAERALERVRLPFGRRAYSAERARLSGCEEEALWRDLEWQNLPLERPMLHPRKESDDESDTVPILEIVDEDLVSQPDCFPLGRRARSAELVRLRGCAYDMAGVRTMLSGCAWAGAPAIWQACVQC